MKKSGSADLPLHDGRVPPWLAKRMEMLGGAITESILIEYGRSAFLKRLSDPNWFQAFGAVLGMDWHSSGITTSVMGALKKAIAPRSHEWGIYVCGGRGSHSRKTPDELMAIGEKTGIDGVAMVRRSRLSAKVDNTTIQDGFQIYLHNFIVSLDGEWAVVQQGMNGQSGMARRYHWHSARAQSLVEEPHSGICGQNQGLILNLTHSEAEITRKGVVNISKENPDQMMKEIKKIILPAHHDVRIEDVDLKRLGGVLSLAHEGNINDFENLLLVRGLGPRTLQSMVLVSEIIHGTPSRFEDPARYSFAHGGKDGHPFPVPTKVYDETIDFLHQSLKAAKLGHSDKKEAFRKLHIMAKQVEKGFKPDPSKFQQWIEKEKKEAHLYGGRTVFTDKRKKAPGSNNNQLSLF